MDTTCENVPWGWVLFLGILLIAVGIAAIILPFAATLAIEILLGWILVIGGILRIIHSFWTRRVGGFFLSLLAGILYLGVGILLLLYPLQGILTLTLLLAILFLIEGICRTISSFQVRPTRNWGWVLVSGIAALVIAFLIWIEWPVSATWAIGLLVGINLIFSGWGMIMLSSAGCASCNSSEQS